jgi:hypothetical protein
MDAEADSTRSRRPPPMDAETDSARSRRPPPMDAETDSVRSRRPPPMDSKTDSVRSQRPSPPTSEPADSTRSQRPPPGAAEQTAVTAFLQSRPPGPGRSRDALWLLARHVSSDEAYLYRASGDRLQLMASVPSADAPPALGAAVLQQLGGRGPAAAWRVEVTNDAGASEPHAKIFRVVPLGAAPFVGAVVYREGEETPLQIADTLLADLTRALAQNIQFPDPSALEPRSA